MMPHVLAAIEKAVDVRVATPGTDATQRYVPADAAALALADQRTALAEGRLAELKESRHATRSQCVARPGATRTGKAYDLVALAGGDGVNTPCHGRSRISGHNSAPIRRAATGRDLSSAPQSRCA
jgi:hypothetical protein